MSMLRTKNQARSRVDIQRAVKHESLASKFGQFVATATPHYENGSLWSASMVSGMAGNMADYIRHSHHNSDMFGQSNEDGGSQSHCNVNLDR